MRFSIFCLSHVVLVTLLTACGAAPSEQSSETASGILDKLKGPTLTGVDDTLLSSARESEAAGNYKRAAGFYQQVLDKSPEDAGTKLALATALRRSGQCNNALPHFEQLIGKDGGNAEALEGKGLCLMAIGESKEAADTFTKALAIDPRRWRSLNAVGIMFAGKGRTEEAIAYFERAQEVDASQMAVMNNLALAYMLDKRYAQAIETFQRAQKRLPAKSPELVRIDLNLALAYALNGDMENAQRTAAPHLTEAELYNNMGFYAKMAKDETMARDYLNMALSKSTTFYKRAWANLETVPKGRDVSSEVEDGVKVKRLKIPGKPYQNPRAPEPPAAPYVAPAFKAGQWGAPPVTPTQTPNLVKGLSEDPDDKTVAQ